MKNNSFNDEKREISIPKISKRNDEKKSIPVKKPSKPLISKEKLKEPKITIEKRSDNNKKI